MNTEYHIEFTFIKSTYIILPNNNLKLFNNMWCNNIVMTQLYIYKKIFKYY